MLIHPVTWKFTTMSTVLKKQFYVGTVLCKQSLSLKGGKNHIFLAIIDYAKLIIIVPICQKVASCFRKEHILII